MVHETSPAADHREATRPLSGATRASILLPLLLVTGVVAAGCGGSKQPSVASIGTAQTTTAASVTAGSGDKTRFATCMTSHGFTASLGSAASAGARQLSIGGVVFSGSVDPSSPQFRSAMEACRKYLPGGGPPSLSPAQQAKWDSAMASFGACIRKNGIPSFRDPKIGAPPAKGLNGIDPSSPLVQKAFHACESLEPSFGPRVAF